MFLVALLWCVVTGDKLKTWLYHRSFHTLNRDIDKFKVLTNEINKHAPNLIKTCSVTPVNNEI
jgi:hypothetical protein